VPRNHDDAETNPMTTELSSRLNRPLQIGNKTIAGRLVLAPMTFLGHVAYRQVLSEAGG
jgi:tRNA-dihydrouridine synthase B